MRRAVMLLLLPALTACTSVNMNARPYLARKKVTHISPESFDHCHGYGCRLIDKVSFTKKDWRDIAAVMKPAKDAVAERKALSGAIGLMEEKAGAFDGTNSDVGGTYVKIGDDQLDCVDESVNTTVYLLALQDKELLRFHDVGAPTARIPPFSRGLGPHQTAVITEKGTAAAYAVDSWFHDNGKPAEIVPLDEWFFGWRPQK